MKKLEQWILNYIDDPEHCVCSGEDEDGSVTVDEIRGKLDDPTDTIRDPTARSDVSLSTSPVLHRPRIHSAQDTRCHSLHARSNRTAPGTGHDCYLGIAIIGVSRMSGKAALKAVRTALDSKDFELAAKKASELVQQEPQNYHAYVRLDVLQARRMLTAMVC